MDDDESAPQGDTSCYEGSAAWYDESWNGDDFDSECTGTEQWDEEARLDPWSEDRLAQEYRRGRDPSYLARWYWAARKAIRRFRAAGG
eukprot:3774803-Amphidinium_carterae.1